MTCTVARPKSEEKRNAILLAANDVVAKLGTEAPTSLIAKQAGVAEGSLFTYFPSKDALLNELYLQIKTELRDAMLPGYPLTASPRDRALHTWRALIGWGVKNPTKRRVMNVLALSGRVTEDSKAAGARAFATFAVLLGEVVSASPMHAVPISFVASLMGAMAETTSEAVAQDPAHASLLTDAGFDAFWRAVGCA
jgi:AcrR family transcriptional regulator